MGQPNETKPTYAGVASTTAAIAAIAVLIRQQKTGQIPPELMELLVAMAADINSVAQWLASFAPGTTPTSYWPPNTDQFTAVRVDLLVAGIAAQLEDMPVPDGMALMLKAWPVNPVNSIIYVGTSAASCLNPLSSFPLIRNEFRTFQIQNAKALWVSTTIAPAFVSVSVEKRG